MTELDTSNMITILHHIAPHSHLQAIDELNLGFSNRSLRITAMLPDNLPVQYVVKHYANQSHVSGNDAATRATREYTILTLLHDAHLPCPEPILFDPQGLILGSPVLVTNHLPGQQILAHPPNPLWAAQAPTVAALLARIHMVSCPAAVIANLPNATTQATWFATHDTVPDYMQAYPDGESIWQILREALPTMTPTTPVLVHGDYWSGNILWEHGQVTGILDWEDVAWGDPGFDIAYCRMEMLIDGMDEAAASFLNTYETITGTPVVNLGLCELAVAVGPMWQRAPYLTISPIQERFRQFVANAKTHL
jgi:aminoglycoside phosphotransferase (APT) family kinase protein